MPILEPTYTPSFIFKNGFVSTVYSGLIRRVDLKQKRKRLTLRDGDFLDLDWSFSTTKTKALILCFHGLEGHGQRPYLTAIAKLFNAQAIDAACVNFRGCSGSDNLKYRSYHSGATEDLEDIIAHVLSLKQYSKIYLFGVSLGGNLILKYLGENKKLPLQIKAAVAVSVPCWLYGSCIELHKLKNKLYAIRFLNHLKRKLHYKTVKHPDKISVKDLETIKTLFDFDNVYTAKAHGFNSAVDYYTKCSSLQYLANITTPTLIINALNDSFLSPECYPVKEALSNTNLYLEIPKYGGHVGFVDKNNVYYNEKRTLEFILQHKT